ncbi:bifunctional glutamate N-acetyltransferase/amino-acid acetyltransferase ArgJ [Pendulispora albinea]|uniref:Arginine biosynthesis bifunctional protein ArgJ n=1 Tax=Pendulispora albinea TaxID=2741071 RepID=A0ABZ2LUK8_9BACT
MKTPIGFKYSGLASGIKPKKKDLALVFSELPAQAAAVLTQNAAKAAPVVDAESRLPASGIQAVVVNSGNANALTGPLGLQAVHQVHATVASALGISESSVLSASTGVIGVRLPVDKIVAATPRLVEGLSGEPDAAAEAILTTDTRVKMASRTFDVEGTPVTLSAIGKGSGMIAPALATMIVVVTTDCAIQAKLLHTALRRAATTSFNQLTVDDDMSTNDIVFALANGAAKNLPIEETGPAFEQFASNLESLCQELAREIAADGEGATKRIEVRIQQSPSVELARDIAKKIAGSSLVKSAIFGADPNWGRVLATVGAHTGTLGLTDVRPDRATVRIQGVTVYRAGDIFEHRELLKAKMREPEILIEVDLDAGTESGIAWGCDLTYDYVKINADYTSLIIETPSGGVAKDDRLSNYSPAFKVSLLVEALGYIEKFRGQRCVIKYGGAAMTKESLKHSFCQDVLLLRAVGLRPIVVHGGGPDITRALERLGGGAPEFIDGVRVTPAADLKVVEMVLTGSINTELVTLLNRNGALAIGLSGKDAALLKARKLIKENGQDLGHVGELVEVNHGLLNLLLDQGYLPVISPVGLGQDGQSYNLNADTVAAGVAVAVGAEKLIYLSDVPGILENGELLSELTVLDLQEKIRSGTVQGGMAVKSDSIVRALNGGIKAVHVLDGRTPHSIIAELFTDKGVGTILHGAWAAGQAGEHGARATK